jgi:putative lipase involved disintegration of autophagic bodies
MGTCNGVFSSCALGGYAMESRCHLGLNIVYDTVSNLTWSVDIRTHSIANVIDRVLSLPWAPSEEIGRQVPEAVPQDDCVVRLEQFSYLD